MNIHFHLKTAGAILLTLSFAHLFFERLFRWKEELSQLTLLTQQVFLVHNFFIALSVGMIGASTLFFTNALLTSGVLSRVVLAGFSVFWLSRLLIQAFVYDSAIWRDHHFYTVMHRIFLMFWIYLVLTYGTALVIACGM